MVVKLYHRNVYRPHWRMVNFCVHRALFDYRAI